MSFTSSVPTFAAEQYNLRADFARKAVRTGKWEQQEAYRKLAPWLAIVLQPSIHIDVDDLTLFSDDRDTLNRAIADLRIKSADGRELVSEGQARWHIADGICPRRLWVRELADARDAAMVAIKPGDEASYMLASGFIAMVMLIGTDPDGRYSVPAYIASAPMQEAA